MQSCSNVHFEVFHLKVENTYEIKRQNKFKVGAILTFFLLLFETFVKMVNVCGFCMTNVDLFHFRGK